MIKKKDAEIAVKHEKALLLAASLCYAPLMNPVKSLGNRLWPACASASRELCRRDAFALLLPVFHCGVFVWGAHGKFRRRRLVLWVAFRDSAVVA